MNNIIHGDCREQFFEWRNSGYVPEVNLIYLDPPFFTQKGWGEFSDKWENIDEYLGFIRKVLLGCRSVLADNGSIYLHCDATANYKIRQLLDDEFGEKNFRNEIVWKMPTPSGFKTQTKSKWIRGHDTIFLYAGEGHTFNKQKDGRGYWLDDVWIDIPSMQTQSVSAAEGVGYPTQKPLALLERIIKASSNPGDLVLDPFCGSGTALVAAKRLGRNYIGIDGNEKAVELTRNRLAGVLV